MGSSFYCLDYKGDIDVLDMVEKILYFALEWVTKDHTLKNLVARYDMLARMQTKNAPSMIPSQYRQPLKSSQIDIG